jgi:hypothetical protein
LCTRARYPRQVRRARAERSSLGFSCSWVETRARPRSARRALEGQYGARLSRRVPETGRARGLPQELRVQSAECRTRVPTTSKGDRYRALPRETATPTGTRCPYPLGLNALSQPS